VLNKYMEAQAPWKLAKTDMKAANRVLYTAAEGLRIATIMLAPVMPEKTANVLDILGASGIPNLFGAN
jgi:methionyl-tRNA synthetase